jgi:hypothetical protein
MFSVNLRMLNVADFDAINYSPNPLDAPVINVILPVKSEGHLYCFLRSIKFQLE